MAFLPSSGVSGSAGRCCRTTSAPPSSGICANSTVSVGVVNLEYGLGTERPEIRRNLLRPGSNAAPAIQGEVPTGVATCVPVRPRDDDVFSAYPLDVAY